MSRYVSVSILLVGVTLLGTMACAPSNIAQASKPIVIINSPPSGSQFSEGDSVRVESTATDAAGIVQVQLFVDGTLFKIDVSPSTQGQVSFNVTQVWKAVPGNHTLVVSAVNSKGAVSSPVGVSVSVSSNQASIPNTASTLPVPSSTSTRVPEVPTFTPIPTITKLPPTTAATPCPKPQIASFAINPTEIKRGDTATLNWGAVTNANTAVIDNGVGGVPAPSAQQVRPDKNTTFTLTANGCGGIVTAQTSVSVFANGSPDSGIPKGRDNISNPYNLQWNRDSRFLYGIEIDIDRSGSFQRFDTKANIDNDNYDVRNLPQGEYRLRFRIWQIDRNTKQRVSLMGKYSIICFPDNGKSCPQP